MQRLCLLLTLVLCLPLAGNAETFPFDFCLPSNYSLVPDEDFPGDYILMPSYLGKLDYENLKNMKDPFIRIVKVSVPKYYVQKMPSELKKQFPRKFEANFSRWGDHSLVSIRMMVHLDTVYLACVDMNDGNVLIFNFYYPQKNLFGNGNSPSHKDTEFWNSFIRKTKPKISQVTPPNDCVKLPQSVK